MSSLVNGKYAFLRCHSMQQSYMGNGGPDFVTAELDAAQRCGFTGARVDINPSTIEPTRGAARSWTSFDQYCDRMLDRSLTFVQWGTYYAPTGTGWVTTNGKQPHADDQAYTRDLMYAVADRFVTNGFPYANQTCHAWNEWDGSIGGGDGTNAHATVLAWLKYFIPLFRTNRASVRMVGPSVASAAGINTTNYDATFRSTCNSVLQNFCSSIYVGIGDMPVNWSRFEYRKKVHDRLDSDIAAFEAVDAQLVGQNFHVTESGASQQKLGFVTSSWTPRGGERHSAEYRVQHYCALLEHPRVQTVSWYMAANQQDSHDGRSENDNCGILASTSLTPYKNTYLAIGRANGLPMVEADELAYWGSWASEPA